VSKVEITDVTRTNAKIMVDGVDVARATRALMFRHSAGGRPELELDLCWADVSEIQSEDVKVYLPPATCEVLIHLGWTPPAES